MKVKVHWVIDGIAEVEADSLEDAEKIVNKKLAYFVSGNPDIEENLLVFTISVPIPKIFISLLIF